MFSVLFGVLGGRVRRVIGAFLFVVSVLLAAGAILAAVTSLNLRANGVKTNATIVDVSTNFSRHSTSYTYLIEFATSDGKQHQASINESRVERAGDTVAVVYDPSDPTTVQEASSLSGLWWITPVALLLFAILFGWIGTRLWRTPRARDR
jgi:Protein of unknown function (DUF3592)